MKQGNFGFVLVVIVVALFYFIFINPTFHPFHPLKVSAIKLVPNGKLERGIFLVQRETKRLSNSNKMVSSMQNMQLQQIYLSNCNRLNFFSKFAINLSVKSSPFSLICARLSAQLMAFNRPRIPSHAGML